MTSIRLLNPTIETAPGEMALGRLEISNEAASETTYRIRVVGIGSESPPLTVTVPPDGTVICEVPVNVTASLGIGQHAAAFEVTSTKLGDHALLSSFTISIASIERVVLTAIPSTIRARRRSTFHLDVENNEAAPVTVQLHGSAPDVDIAFTPDRFDVAPGQRVVATAKVKGPRHWSGEPAQHNLLLTAHGRAASTSITAPYIQRPLFAHRARMLIAGLTVIALWLGAIGGVALWLSNRDSGVTDASTTIVAVDTDGDGVPDAFFDVNGNPLVAVDTDGDGVPDSFTDADGNPITGTDTDGDGVPDSFVDADGNPIKGVDTDGDGIVDTFLDANGNPITPAADEVSAAPAPTSTVLRGTIEADGKVDDVQIVLAPIALGAPPAAQSNVQAFSGAGSGTSASTKIWSARFAQLDSTASTRITQPVAPLATTPAADGIWLFSDVPLGQSYEIVFSKPGFDTQSFIVTPPADGSAIELAVKLKASTGSLSGRVTGPTGGLGGAEVTITDGTLTFTTTSATDGDVGSWMLEGVSTPGVYTVSAALRGYGTEVLQVRLDAGQNRTNADLVMQPGVGAVSGRILGESGEPLGGVTVTANDGASSATTTSLTEGNIGFFSIPQLAVPGTYTIGVELDGYVTQTRRVSLGGSLTGLDFNLVDSSLRLTGRVTDTNGTGIVSAGVTLSTGDLQFKVPTAAAPTAGAFVVDDLPPGLYTVTFDHYLHDSQTEFITLEAGVPPAPVNVALVKSTGPPAVGTGTLRVEVVDPNAKDPVPREVKDATVKVFDYTTKELVAQSTQEGNNFRFPNLPIGTYSVDTTAPSYNSSIGRLVTIGIETRSIDVFMQRLGAASGKLVDPTDASKVFPNSRVNLYLEPREPGDNPYAFAVANSLGVWQTAPDALQTGTYSIDVLQGPAIRGYFIPGDQILDPAVTGADRAMKFVVPDDVIEPIVVTPINAYPYPAIRGNVYRPVASAAAFTAIDEPALAVSMTCPGGTPTNATITDELTTVNATLALNDTFLITKEEVDSNNLTGNCELTYSAGGFQTITKPLLGVQPATGTVKSDRQQNVAMTRPAPNIRGSVFWIDKGITLPADQKVFLDSVEVTSDRITEYLPGEGVTLPQAKSTIGSDTSDANGDWALPGQLFGEADYKFIAPAFDQATVRVTVDENGRATATSDSVAGTVSGDLASGFAVQLLKPNNGSISGTITIESSTTKTFGDVVVSATDPAGNPVTQPTILRPTPDTFRINDAMAGTWTVVFSTPPTYEFFPPGQASRRPVVKPGQDVTGVTTGVVKLGTLELTLTGVTNTPIITPPTVTLTSTGSTLGGVTITNRPLTVKSGGPSNVFVLDKISVADLNPAVNPVDYTLAITLAGYDTSLVQSIPLQVRAGELVPKTVVLPKQGTVSGTIVGDVTGDGTAPQNRLIDGTTTRLDVTQITGDGGVPIIGAPPVAPTFTANSYSFGGPAGWYRISVASVGFAPVSRDVLVLNDTDNPQNFSLEIIRGSVDLTVVRALIGGAAVAGATYQLSSGACSILPPTSATKVAVGASGKVAVGNLIPGAYCLQVREESGVVELAFPAIATIMVDRSTTPLPTDGTAHAPGGDLVVVTAPLPNILPSVTGTVRAVSGTIAGPPVPLPDSILLTLDYTGTSIRIDGTDTPNAEVLADGTDTVTRPTPTASQASYEFTNVPAGSHVLKPQTGIAGYTPVATELLFTVGTDGAFGPTTGPDVIYVVSLVTVEVKLTPGDKFFFATPPTLTSPVKSVSYTAQPFDSTTNTLTFLNVASEIGDFTLTISDPLHTYSPASPVFAVPVITTPPLVQTVNLTPTKIKGRVTGSLTQFNTNTSSGDMGRDAVIRLRRTDVTGQVDVTFTTTGPTASYFLDAPAGSYDLSVALAGFTEPVYPITITNGRQTDQNLRVNKLATINATILNATVPAGTTVVLVTNDTTVSERPLAQVGATDVYTLQVVAGNYQYVEARSPGYIPVRNPSTASSVLVLGIGTITLPSFTLNPRTVTVNPVDQSTGTAITNATVSVTVGGVTPAAKTAAPYVFTSIDAGTAIPISGTGTATVSAPGYRTRTFTVPDPSTAAILAPLNPAVTVTGTINAPNGIDVVTASAPGMPDVRGSISAGNYTVTGLGVGTDGSAKTWTLRYDRIGAGWTGVTGVVLPDVTFVSANSITQNIALTVRKAAYTFTVADPNGDPVGNAPIAIFAGTTQLATGATANNSGGGNVKGVVTLQVDENSAPTRWVVSDPAYLVRSGVIASVTTLTNPVPVTLIPAVTGTVTDAGAAVGDPAVTICESASVAACAAPAASSTAGGAFTFNGELAPGTYKVWAVKGLKSGSATLIVTATTTTPSPLPIAIS